MKRFSSLRMIPWTPTFEWVQDIEKAADIINRPHREDYPGYVASTAKTLKVLATYETLRRDLVESEPFVLRLVHTNIFLGAYDGGRFRQGDVRIGLFIPPPWELVPKYLDELHDARLVHPIKTVEDLQDWYYDFETVHPFINGNGRVGGTVVAALSRVIEPERGYLVPGDHGDAPKVPDSWRSWRGIIEVMTDHDTEGV